MVKGLLLREGMAWLDTQSSDGDPAFYFPSLWPEFADI